MCMIFSTQSGNQKSLANLKFNPKQQMKQNFLLSRLSKTEFVTLTLTKTLEVIITTNIPHFAFYKF